MANNPNCSNPAWGTHIIVRGNLREGTLESVLQRVMKWAENDRQLIEYHSGGDVAYVRIPPEVIRNDHGELKLTADGEPIELAHDRAVWVEPTIFDVDGVNPNTLIEYDQVISDFGPKGEPTHEEILLRFTYDGNSQEKTEPSAWILRWREKAAEGECPEKWDIIDLPGWTRVIPLHGLAADTEYEFTLQGVAKPESTAVRTPSSEPITVATKPKPAPGQDDQPAPEPEPEPEPAGGGEKKPAPSGGGKIRATK